MIETKKRQENVLSSSMEDYLECIFVLKETKNVVRVCDLTQLMNVKTSSTASALNFLSKTGYVIHERYGCVQLTEQGEKLAKLIYRRHKTLIRFIDEILGVNKKIAAQDACKIEHAISVDTFERLSKFLEFMDEGHHVKWLSDFRQYCNDNQSFKRKTKG
ncbi:MAG: metal-dependent transcriptional regulator [Candidatus Omnitrophica bacterium]|nr:metal-dependent transcriptional regulator [Candidatus Omnitrophota bacterium]